jgi:hypothetical protein
MAISVDTIYQRVLALANKEQRGYITPQEFNLLANQAQMQIFESYFYAKNQRNRTELNKTNEVDETDIDELLARKLAPFSTIAAVTSGNTFPAQVTIDEVARDVFQVGMILSGNEPCQKVSVFEAQRLKNSTRHMATTAGRAPIYTDSRTDGDDIQVYAGSVAPETSGVTAEYFGVPRPANWAYVIVNEKALYNATLAVNFELHRSEEDTLVDRILALAGIVINKIGLAQTATSMSANETQVQNT